MKFMLATASAAMTVLLLGCSSSTVVDPGPPIPSVTAPISSADPPAPTLPSDVPTTGPNLLHPGEKPPLEPVAALVHTAAGAQAFARFFIQTIDWGYATTNPSYMKHYFADSCIECKNLENFLDTAHSRSEHYVGGRISIESVTAEKSSDSSSSFTASTAATSYEVLDAQGRSVDAGAADTRDSVVVTVRWANDRWLVIDLK